MGPGRPSREADLDAEIRAHIEMAIQDRMDQGESRQEAERAVRREFGNEIRVKEVTREQWRGTIGSWLDSVGQDLRYGVRSLMRDRGFALAAILILVVGIGANAVVFTLVDRTFIEDPPGIDDPDALVGLTWIQEQGPRNWSYHDFDFVRRESQVFSDVLAYMGPLTAALGTEVGPATPVGAWAVSGNFFSALGTEMAMGRGFLPEEGRTVGTHPVTVLSHGLWQRELGGDPDILSRTVTVNGTPLQVVGVVEADFRGISPLELPADLYMPLQMQGVLAPGWEGFFELGPGQTHSLYKVVARLDEGVDLDAAEASLAGLMTAWDDEFGDWAADAGVDSVSIALASQPGLFPLEAERLRGMLELLGAVVLAVLLIGCANLAILLLARAGSRADEMGIRAALGAGRSRLLRQLLTESTLLATVGSILGLIVAWWGADLVGRLLPFYFAGGTRPDATVVVGTALVALVVTGIFGLLPAVRLSRSAITSSLRRQRTATRGRAGRRVLVVAQVAVAVVLVAGAGLFMRSLWSSQSVDLGFDPENRLLMSVQLGNHGYDNAGVQAFQQQVLERVRGLPGVESAAVTDRGPFSGRWTSRIRPLDTEFEEEGLNLYMKRAGADYFRTMGIEIVDGRPLDDSDDAEGVHSLVVSRTTATRFWPEGGGVGQQMRWQNEAWTVVGVADDARYYEIGQDPPSQIYVPQGHVEGGNLTFVLRTAVPAADRAPAAEAAIHELDSSVAVFGTETLQDLLNKQTASYRALAILVTLFGGIALFMAVVGLYGVQAYLVGRGRREIGIRMALGARARELAAGVLGRGSALAAVGVGIGIAVALAMGRLVQEMLFGVEPSDPATLAVVAAVVLMASVAASWVPAQRASRVDPMRVLRAE